MMEFVSWDDDIPNIRKNKIHVPNHQSEMDAMESQHVFFGKSKQSKHHRRFPSHRSRGISKLDLRRAKSSAFAAKF